MAEVGNTFDRYTGALHVPAAEHSRKCVDEAVTVQEELDLSLAATQIGQTHRCKIDYVAGILEIHEALQNSHEAHGYECLVWGILLQDACDYLEAFKDDLGVLLGLEEAFNYI